MKNQEQVLITKLKARPISKMMDVMCMSKVLCFALKTINKPHKEERKMHDEVVNDVFLDGILDDDEINACEEDDVIEVDVKCGRCMSIMFACFLRM